MLRGGDGRWRSLNPSAQRIWEVFEYPATASAAASALTAEYGLTPAAASAVVLEQIDAMASAGLVAAVEPPFDLHRFRYLRLIKRALVNLLYPEHEIYIKELEANGPPGDRLEAQRAFRDVAQRHPDRLARLVAGKGDGLTRSVRFSHTMIGLARLENIERCAETLFTEEIEGDFLEAGVCQGGATIFMRALQHAHGQAHRRTWVVDSFCGLPPSGSPDDARYGLKLDEPNVPTLACSEETVREHFARYDLLDEGSCFVAGWLAQSIPDAGIGRLALLRIDVDLYSSTSEALELLYPKLAPGGFVIIDDYGTLQCCADAVNDFRSRHGVAEPIVDIDRNGVYWRKATAA
jgi:hypothetical protein